MKYWTIAFPGEFGQGVVETWSEEQIIRSYYPYWSEKMIEAAPDPTMLDLSSHRCIDDWVVIHWAVRTDEFGRKTFGDCDCGCNKPVASTPQDMLKFLEQRFEYAGVSDAVAKTYARDIRFILEKFYETDSN